MDGTAQGSPHVGGTLAVNNFSANNSWNGAQTTANENSTFLFIAVEYVKDTNEYKFSSEVSYSPQGNSSCANFEQHVSPLDPNMSSAARYSPSCTDSEVAFENPTVQQLISENSTQQLITTTANTYVDNLTGAESSLDIPTTLSSSDANLLKQVVTNRYLLNQQNVPDSMSSPNVLQLVPDAAGEPEVELLITDQATGISYVSTQEYLVGRLSDDQQLLDVLDSDLLALEESTLKSELPDIVDSVNTSALDAQPLVSSLTIENTSCDVKELKIEESDDQTYNQDNLRRSQRQVGLQFRENEEQLLTQVHAIVDKPVETRARATLPNSYLLILKQGDGLEYGVFARKVIPKQTQFGPLEGIRVNIDQQKADSSDLQLFITSDRGIKYKLDVSDENTANWMRFVRKADTYDEQNLIVSQQAGALYYTTTRRIWPKEELKVGYSTSYAKQHNLPQLQSLEQNENEWPCFECDKQFSTSRELEKHSTIHDVIVVKRKSLKSKKKKVQKKYAKYVLECKQCKDTFSSPGLSTLRKHLLVHGISDCKSFEDKFNIFSERDLLENIDDNKNGKASSETKAGCKCPVCYKMFASLDRIQKHMLVHGSEDSKPLKCDICDKRFLNNSALGCHLKTHNTDKTNFECPMCKESFNHVIQLKIHVPKHCINGKYTCPHCKKVFQEYSIIRKHIRAFHCDRKHICPHCGKLFPTLDKLRMHLLRHSDHREFLCADCGKQFKRKDKLKEHIKRMHSEERENTVPKLTKTNMQHKKFTPKVQPTDYLRFIYKCHTCLVGFKRRGMLVNHLAKRHPDIRPDSVPELNLPILRTTRDYYCQYCDKVYKSSSKRKAHILKNHPGQALPMSNRRQGAFPDLAGLPNPTFSQTVGSITTHPQACQWCHKQYASKAKLLQHQRKKHSEMMQNRSKETKNHLQNQVVPSKQDMEDIVIDAHTFKKDFKVSDEELLSEVVALNDEKVVEHYYQIISLPQNDPLNVGHTSDSNQVTGDSRLYRLLTTGNGLLPPR